MTGSPPRQPGSVRKPAAPKAERPPTRATPGHWAGVGLRQAIVIFATLLSLFPVYFMAVSAFKTKSQYLDQQVGAAVTSPPSPISAPRSPERSSSFASPTA